MENASKALIMAAGVLIGVLILSLAVYLFVSFGSTSAQINAQNAEQRIIQFNTKFTSYLYKEGLTIYDVITVAGYANENNKYYEDNPNYYIDVKIGSKSILGQVKDETEKNKLITNGINSDGTLIVYTCSSNNNIEYNQETGRVKTIVFNKK